MSLNNSIYLINMLQKGGKKKKRKNEKERQYVQYNNYIVCQALSRYDIHVSEYEIFAFSIL